MSSTEKEARQYWIQRWQVDVYDVTHLCVSGSCGCYTALTPAGHSVMQPLLCGLQVSEGGQCRNCVEILRCSRNNN